MDTDVDHSVGMAWRRGAMILLRVPLVLLDVSLRVRKPKRVLMYVRDHCLERT